MIMSLEWRSLKYILRIGNILFFQFNIVKEKEIKYTYLIRKYDWTLGKLTKLLSFKLKYGTFTFFKLFDECKYM